MSGRGSADQIRQSSLPLFYDELAVRAHQRCFSCIAQQKIKFQNQET
jgi:hypothetical protein